VSTYLVTSYTLAAMVATFALCSWRLRSPELSMMITAVVGAAVAGLGFPARLLVEGTFTFLDLAFIFITACVFMNAYSEVGAMNALVRALVVRLHRRKWLLLLVLALLMLIPGALTGAGVVSVLVVGGLVAAVLRLMGLSEQRVAAFVFMLGILSAVAPPINVWAMLMAAGANMPYVGFDLVLLPPVLLVTAFTVVYLGWGAVPQSKEAILAGLPPLPEKMTWWRAALPLIILVALALLAKYAAFSLPTLGFPLIFLICALATVAIDPLRRPPARWLEVVNATVEQVFPLVATMVSVGALVNILAATGVRGLIAISFIGLPILGIYLTSLFVCPMAQGSLGFGSAVILGTPLIFVFNAVGANVTVVASAFSLLFALGDCLPPSRIVGRTAIETVGYEGSYASFLKATAVPWVAMGAVSLAMLVFPNQFMTVFFKQPPQLLKLALDAVGSVVK
jgi:TRAP-type C4-dicarboxylate transport system permease large subunit